MLNRLPPLNAVKAFHAVSRHLNLSRAAEELGVTQGAVSKQIIALEDFIGAKLFERTPSGLELTEEDLMEYARIHMRPDERVSLTFVPHGHGSS